MYMDVLTESYYKEVGSIWTNISWSNATVEHTLELEKYRCIYQNGAVHKKLRV